MQRKLVGIRAAVDWIARNDDVDLGDEDAGGFLISIMMTAELFDREPRDIAAMVVRLRARE